MSMILIQSIEVKNAKINSINTKILMNLEPKLGSRTNKVQNSTQLEIFNKTPWCHLTSQIIHKNGKTTFNMWYVNLIKH